MIKRKKNFISLQQRHVCLRVSSLPLLQQPARPCCITVSLLRPAVPQESLSGQYHLLARIVVLRNVKRYEIVLSQSASYEIFQRAE